MKNLDVPFEFLWRWAATRLEDFDLSGSTPRLLNLHPETLSDAVERDNRRAALVHPLVEELRDRLVAGEQTPLEATTTHQEMNVRLTLTIEEAAPRDVPARDGILGGPGLGGHVPEAMFERLVKQKVRDKAGKRQARSEGTALEILIVDVSGSKIEGELRHENYSTPHRPAVPTRRASPGPSRSARSLPSAVSSRSVVPSRLSTGKRLRV